MLWFIIEDDDTISKAEFEMVKHFSHRHELYRISQVQEDDEMVICSGCELHLLSGSAAYKCTKSNCEFYLHDLCFQLPPQIHHNSHPKHPLTLISTFPHEYEYGEFRCDACGESGTCFAFHCPNCKYDLHVQCATLPETLSLQHHQHLLSLVYSLPLPNENDEQVEEQQLANCDVCQAIFSEGCWAYYCKDCDYGTHLDCAFNC